MKRRGFNLAFGLAILVWFCTIPVSARAQSDFAPPVDSASLPAIEEALQPVPQPEPVDSAVAPAANTSAEAIDPANAPNAGEPQAVPPPTPPRGPQTGAPLAASSGEIAKDVPIDPSTGRPLDQPFFHNFVHEFGRDEYHMWRGPFRKSNYGRRTMQKYGIPFLLISAALIATDRSTARWLPNTTGQVIWSGRVSQIGAPYTLAGFAGVFYGIGRATGNGHVRETGFLALEALADSQMIALVLKEATQRQRPSAPDVRGTGFWHGGSSFPSGHALGSFSVASVFAYEYRQHIAVPIVAYSLATVVDLSRFGARAHWYSDVFVGSSMGFLIGRYTYKNHHDPDLPGSPVPRGIARWKPTFGPGPQGIGLYWQL